MRINNPVGEIALWATSTAPTGWLIADGSTVSRSTYSALFAVISTTYGVGDGSTTFGLPNLKGKVPVGRDSSDVAFDTMGETGGVKTNALVVGNLPAHTHDSPSSSSSSTSLTNASAVVVEGAGNALLLNGAQGLETYGPYNAVSVTASTTTTTTTTVSGGGNGTATGTAFDNLQPYITLNYIIRF
jgi:microcystin-dependent protein